jgi:hypothetical protein
VFETLFVPDQEATTEKIETIKAHFGFMEEISETAESLKTLVSGVTDFTPVIYADISLANGKYDWGSGNVPVLDFRWYAPFKGVADAVIIAIAYALFFWKLFMRLPSIISGSSAIIEYDSNTKDN